VQQANEASARRRHSSARSGAHLKAAAAPHIMHKDIMACFNMLRIVISLALRGR
jgi:hypothetical protein